MCLHNVATAGNVQADRVLQQLEKKAAEIQTVGEQLRQQLEEQWNEYLQTYEQANKMREVRKGGV
jgi:uncharacterized damage-inducible protein DinB